MKFTYIVAALLAGVSQAQPIEEQGPTTGPQLVTANSDLNSNESGQLQRRADTTFNVYISPDCSTGGTGIRVAQNNEAKGDFSVLQRSVKLTGLNAGFHLSLYTQRGQQPANSPNLRLNVGNIGQCFTFSPGWLSYGLFRD